MLPFDRLRANGIETLKANAVDKLGTNEFDRLRVNGIEMLGANAADKLRANAIETLKINAIDKLGTNEFDRLRAIGLNKLRACPVPVTANRNETGVNGKAGNPFVLSLHVLSLSKGRSTNWHMRAKL